MVPDIPYSLDIKIKRERYLAKQALQVSIDNLVALVGLGVKVKDISLCRMQNISLKLQMDKAPKKFEVSFYNNK